MSPDAVHWLPTLAGLLQFAQLPSMRLVMPKLGLDAELRGLSPLLGRLMGLFAAGIVACVAGLGAVVVANHGELLVTATGRGLCLFLGAYWLARGLVQWIVLAPVWPARAHRVHLCLAVFYPALGAAYCVAWLRCL
jgi:hypothetical protein